MDQEIYCGVCGFQNNTDSNYCTGCGASLMDQQQSYQQTQYKQQPQYDPSYDQMRYQPQPGSYIGGKPGQAPYKDVSTIMQLTVLFPGAFYWSFGDQGKAVLISLGVYLLYAAFGLGFFVHVYLFYQSYAKTKEYNRYHGYYFD